MLLAVSGGADSTALLHLVANVRAHLHDPALHVVTVDHGLRDESRDEAEAVGRLCRHYGLPHRILQWNGDRRGNLSAAAREARYDLLGQEAWRVGAQAVVTAHHLDDQIETHLLALARGGQGRALAGMRPLRALRPGVVLARPFIGLRGARLRATLRDAGIGWHEDPTNSDLHYARARCRAALSGGGIDIAAVLTALQQAGRQRETHDRAVKAALRSARVTADHAGTVQLDLRSLTALAPGLRRAILGRAITAAGGVLHPPNAEKLDRLIGGLLSETGRATLGGACLSWRGDRLAIIREYGRGGIAPVSMTAGRNWFDRRFVLSGETCGSVVALGTTGRGNAVERCLPVLVGETGAVLARHPAIRQWRDGPVEVLDAQESVGWRLGADL